MTTTTNQVATQVKYPWKATLRTVIQTAVPTILTVVAVLGVLQDSFNVYLPASVIAWVAGASAFLVVLAGALTRIFAIPAVDAWLTGLGLGATPNASTSTTISDATTAEDDTFGSDAVESES